MKRIISLTLALIMLFAVSAPCFAIGSSKAPEVCDFEGKIRFSCALAGTDIDDDMKKTLEYLKDVKIDYRGTAIEKGPLAAQAYFEAEIIAGLTYIPLKFWLDLDMTDLNNMTYIIVAEIPEALGAILGIDKQYMVIDYSKIIDMAEMTQVMQWPLAKAQDMEKELFEELLSGIAVKTIGSNHYKVAVNDKQAKEILVKFIDLIFSKEFLGGLVAEDEYEEAIAPIKAELPKIYSILSSVEIFPGDGIVYEYKTNNNDYITYEKSSVNFKIDAAGWVKAISAVYPEMNEDMPETDVVFTAWLESESEYKNIGTAGPIVFPTITEDNSFDVAHMVMVQQREYSYEPVKVYIDYEYMYFPDAQPELVADRTMVPASVLFRALGGQMEYEVADGVGVVTGTLGENAVKLTIGNNTAYVNGEVVELDVAAYINAQDRTMVPIRFIAENFGLEVSYLNNVNYASYEDYEEYYAEFMGYEEYLEFMEDMQSWSMYDLRVDINSYNF